MTVTSGALGRRRTRVASLSRHPELIPAAAVLAAWIALMVFAVRAVGSATSGTMPGMSAPGTPATSGSPWATALAALPSWLVMTVAMMGPAVLGKFRDAAGSGSGTARMVAAFGIGYLAVWAAFGLIAEAAATAIRGVPSPRALTLCLAVATAWQVIPLKHRVLRACRAAGPAVQSAADRRAASRCAPRQRAISAFALRRGLRLGLCCLGTCWCLMLVPLAAPGGQLPWMAGLAILISGERLITGGPGTDSRAATRAVTRATAGALAIAAVATLAVSGMLQ